MKAEYLPGKWRHARPENTRWLKYAIEKGYIKVNPATGSVLLRNGKAPKMKKNQFGYTFFQVHMHRCTFTFFLHKAVYVALHGDIPKQRELDHDDGNLENNIGSNIIARSTFENLKKVRRRHKVQTAF